MPSIWEKYKIIKEIGLSENIKTYLTSFEPIIKEIIVKDEDRKYEIYEFFNIMKEGLKIYEIIEENNKIYLVAEKDEEKNKRIDEIILKNEYKIKKECVLEGQKESMTKEEILNLLKLEESMCRLKFKKLINNNIKEDKYTGFFCEIENEKYPVKYCLFTNNHVINEENIEINKKIKFEYFNGKKYVEKEIKITKDRKIITNKELYYTCIEIFKSDGIKKYFKIEPKLYKTTNNEFLKDKDIFALQYTNGNDMSFSYGKIKALTNNKLIHSASTDKDSSGSPIILRNKENNLIGITKDNNFAIKINSILEYLKPNEIICTYLPYIEEEISLIHDYNFSKEDMKDWLEEEKKGYLEAKELNKKLYTDETELYVNDEKIKFNFKYKIKDLKDFKEIKVKFKFKSNLTNMRCMFCNCSSLKSIDLSCLNTSNVNNMSCMFYGCSSLKSIDLTSLNTSNVNNMSGLFIACTSLKSIDLSSLNTSKVNNMHSMFGACSKLESIDLSSLNTSNVNNMCNMFYGCSSLKSIDLSSLNTSNVNNMCNMFHGCSSLKSVDLSSLNISKVNNMNDMFSCCTSLTKENIKMNNIIGGNLMFK